MCYVPKDKAFPWERTSEPNPWPPRPAPVYSASYKPPTESIAKRAIVIDATEGEIRDWIAAIDDLRDMRVRLKRLLRQMKAAA